MLKRFFSPQHLNQIGSRIVEQMVIYDHTNMAWQILELNGYLKFLATGVGRSIAKLYDGAKGLVPHPYAKTV